MASRKGAGKGDGKSVAKEKEKLLNELQQLKVFVRQQECEIQDLQVRLAYAEQEARRARQYMSSANLQRYDDDEPALEQTEPQSQSAPSIVEASVATFQARRFVFTEHCAVQVTPDFVSVGCQGPECTTRTVGHQILKVPGMVTRKLQHGESYVETMRKKKRGAKGGKRHGRAKASQVEPS